MARHRGYGGSVPQDCGSSANERKAMKENVEVILHAEAAPFGCGHQADAGSDHG